MDSNQLKSLTKFTCNEVGFVAQFILRELKKVNPNEIETKSLNSLVSYVDKNAEMQLVDKLSKLLPKATFLTEEETIENSEGEYRWIIDPLDGTTNFLHGLPIYAVSVGLIHNKQPILGMIYEPNQDEMFYASKGNGAFLNDKSIQVSPAETLSTSLLATGFPYYDFSYQRPFTPDDLEAIEKKMTELVKEDHPVRREVMQRDQAVEFF